MECMDLVEDLLITIITMEVGWRGGLTSNTMDNIIIISSIIAENKEKKRPTYLFFGDAEKCFDKLWLKDCVLELARLGVPAVDALMLFKMNNGANIIIKTPLGNTEKIKTGEIVRQGTVFGPIFCCASIARINDIGEKVVEKCGTVEVGMPLFMDDVNTTTHQADNIRKSIRNCSQMEI